MVTGKPQVVMVHVNVARERPDGIINAAVIMSHSVLSRPYPLTEAGSGVARFYIHWAQESLTRPACCVSM